MDRSRIRCSRIKADGERCKRYARAGTTVCDAHGGKAPQTMAKAKERLFEAIDPVMAKLVQIALDDSRGGEQVRAATFLAERAGFSSKQEITLEAKPWEGMVAGILEEVDDDIIDAEEVLTSSPDYTALEASRLAAIDPRPDADVIDLPEVVGKPQMPRATREGLNRLR